MKRTIFLASLLALVLPFTSCSKDDMELLKHPYRVQGNLDPTFELPVISSGQLNLNDLLMSFDGTFSGYILDDTVITFHYDTSLSQRINVGNGIQIIAPLE